MLDSFLAQVRVSGGFPVHTQVKVTSEPISVVRGFGSTTMRGATGRGEQGKRCYRSGPSSLKGPRWRPKALGSSRLSLGSYAPYSQWTSTRVLTLVLPTSLRTSQETGSVKNV